mmetsp:Transcript_976/g.2795  ORF Transcript_976/g.2795 Transcript_976/m.2795 type:complete len:292 (-) Transcript_976:159-1034(-)
MLSALRVLGPRCGVSRFSTQVTRVGPDAVILGRVAGKSAIVTGGAGALGAAISQLLGAQGASVVVADVDGEAARKVASEIPGGHFATVDVRDVSQVDAVVRETAATFGRLDIVINQAGIVGELNTISEMSTEGWREVIDVNLNGFFYVFRAALRQMEQQDPAGGVNVNMSSVAGHTGLDQMPAYAASKAAVSAITRTAAVSHARKGIRSVAVAPTAVKTPMADGILAEAPSELRELLTDKLNPMPGRPLPEDVANAVLFLCSEEARYISGCTLPVDGAFLSGNVFPHARGQ